MQESHSYIDAGRLKQNASSHYKQIISLPYAKKKNTSQPYSPASIQKLTVDQSQANIESH